MTHKAVSGHLESAVPGYPFCAVFGQLSLATKSNIEVFAMEGTLAYSRGSS